MKKLIQILAAFMLLPMTGCFNLEDDAPAPIVVVKPGDVNVYITQEGDVVEVIFEEGALQIDGRTYVNVGGSATNVYVNANDSIFIGGDHIYNITHTSVMNVIDQSGQSTPVTVYFAPGAFTFNNVVYTPVTINSPVYVNNTDNSRVIVEGDNIHIVTKVENKTFVDLSGQKTVVEVNFAQGAISFNNEVFFENTNNWYSDDDVWIKVDGDTITQTQMSVYNLSLYQLTLNHYAVQDSFPMQGDTLLIPSTDTLVTALFDGDSDMLRNNHSGVSFQDVMNVGLPLNLSSGTGNFNWFFPADSTVGLFYAMSRVNAILCADDSFMVRLYDMNGVDSATLKVSTHTTTGGRDVCDALSTNGNNITIAKYFAYRIVNQTAGMQVPANSAFSVRSKVDPSKGVTLKTYVNPDPQTYPVTGMFVTKKSNAFKRFDPQQSGLEHNM